MRQVTAVTFRILEREHLHFKEEAERWAIAFTSQSRPKIEEEMLPGFVVRTAEQILEGGLQAKVNQLHHFSDQGFLRAEIMEQHPGAGPDRAREGTERKMGDAVPEKVGKALVKESIPGYDVTVVTYQALVVNDSLISSTLGIG
jgi:hypothetical protein